jgi:hypothetical protein
MVARVFQRFPLNPGRHYQELRPLHFGVAHHCRQFEFLPHWIPQTSLDADHFWHFNLSLTIPGSQSVVPAPIEGFDDGISCLRYELFFGWMA